MANDLLDPLKQDESGSEPDFNSEKNVSQDHYDKTFNDITSSPENQAFGDQMESLAGDNGNNEFSYSPDAERRNLADQESKGSADANTTPPQGEALAINNAGQEIPYSQKSGNKRSKFRGFISHRYTKGGLVGGGVVGLLISGFIGIAPFKVLHYAQLLQNWHFFDDDQSGNWSTRRIYNYAGSQRQYNNLGVAGNKIANKYQSRLADAGIELDFKNPDGKSRASVQKMTLDMDNGSAKDFARKLSAEFDLDIDLNATGKIDIDLRGKGSTKLGRSVISSAVDDVLKMNKVSSALSKRLLKRRAGVGFHPLRNLARERTEETADGRRKTDQDIKNEDRERRAKEAKRGTYDIDLPKNGTQEVENPDGTKTTIPDAGAEHADDVDIIDTAEKLRDAEPSLDRKKGIANLQKRVLTRGVGGAAAVAGILCAVKDIGNSAVELQYANTILTSIRVSSQLIGAGAQIQAGQNLSAESVAAISETLFDPELGDFLAASAAQGELGKEAIGYDLPDGSKPTDVGDKPVLFEIIDGIHGLSSICDVGDWFDKTLGKIPGVKQAQDLMSQAVSKSAEFVTGKSTEEWMSELIGWVANNGVDPLATGAELGAVAINGAKLASNMAMSALGAVGLDNTEVAKWDKIQQDTLLAERKSQSLYTRFIDLKNPNSLSAVAILQTPATTSPTALAYTIRSNPLVIISGVSESLAKIAAPKAYAKQSSSYNYGFKDQGFETGVLNDPLYSNPYCNAAYIKGGKCVANDQNDISPDDGVEETVRTYSSDYSDIVSNGDGTVTLTYPEGNLSKFNKLFGECFGNPVDNQGNLTNTEMDSDDYEKMNSCNKDLPEGEGFTRYRLYLLDRSTTASLSCYEGLDDTACSEIGLSSSNSTSEGGEPSGPLPTGEIPKSETVHVPSCGGQGWTTAKVIANQLDAMCKKATADGTPLSINNSHRTTAEQIELRKKNCGTSHYAIYEMSSGQCTPPTAKPSQSEHQKGLAIDFASCKTRSTACFIWLSANAAQFGFKNLPSEPWHWSTSGG